METDIESGLRWGELTELRVRDIEFSSRMLTVSRAVVQVSPQFHPQGGRFLVKDYPKDREFRRFKLSAQIVAKLQAHVVEHGLGRDDLLFWAPEPDGPRVRKLRLVVDPETLGLTEPNAAGRRYRHGTMTGYSLGRCRCDYCKDAYARYRAERQGSGQGRSARGRSLDTDGHIPAQWFRLSCVAASAEGGEPGDPCPLARFAACACLVAARWWRRPPGREAATWARQPADDGAVPAHPARCRRNRFACPRPCARSSL